MGEIEDRGRLLVKEMAKLDEETRVVVESILKKIRKNCKNAELCFREIFKSQPEIAILKNGYKGEVLDETREWINKYNIECDIQSTLIGMIPVKTIRDVFILPEKILI